MDTIDTMFRREQVTPRALNRFWLGGSNNQRDFFSWLFGNARQWACKRASRRTLRNLTDVQLHDIGITRREATREVSKSFFWD
jgi:uncharacterized protein YjiS (DUF1127 family)